MKKSILIILSFIILSSLFFIRPVIAITETSGDLQITYDEPLFPPTIVWYPALSVAKPLSVKNIGRSTHTASLRASNTSQTGDFASNLFLRVDEGAVNKYGGLNNKTLKNFWDNGETNLSDISSGNTTTYTVTVSMPSTLGNEFQGKGATFDLDVGFVGTEAKVNLPAGEIKGEKTQVSGQKNWFVIFLVTVSGTLLLRIFFLARKNG